MPVATVGERAASVLSRKFLNIVWTTRLGSASPSIPLIERWLCQLEGEATLSRMPWTMYANFWDATLGGVA